MVHNGKGKQDWCTPEWVIQEIQLFHGNVIDLDVACTVDNCKGVQGYYDDLGEDGLTSTWFGDLVFCNPPFRRVLPWVKKAISEIDRYYTCIMLLNASTDSEWFHTLYEHDNVGIGFIRRRIAFIDSDGKPKKNNSYAQMIAIVSSRDYNVQHTAKTMAKNISLRRLTI